VAGGKVSGTGVNFCRAAPLPSRRRTGSCIANVRQIRIGSKHGMISPSTTALDGVETPVPHVPPVSTLKDTPKQATPSKSAPSAQKRAARGKKQAVSGRVNRQSQSASTPNLTPSSASASPRQKPRRAGSPAQAPLGTMLDALVKAVGRARAGKSVDQLQNQLGWTKVQIRNAIYRASARGWLETVRPGRYRQTV
jgi:hypothetical protein